MRQILIVEMLLGSGNAKAAWYVRILHKVKNVCGKCSHARALCRKRARVYVGLSGWSEPWKIEWRTLFAKSLNEECVSRFWWILRLNCWWKIKDLKLPFALTQNTFSHDFGYNNFILVSNHVQHPPRPPCWTQISRKILAPTCTS